MADQVFDRKINGVRHVATRKVDDEGNDYIEVKSTKGEQRFSPAYTTDELVRVLTETDGL